MNTGHDFTLANVCDTFKEVEIEEPDWQEVSSNLELVIYGQVSVTELYEAWCKCGPSWEMLSQALGKFSEYQQVAKQAKKKAGVYRMNALKVCDYKVMYPYYTCMTIYSERSGSCSD